MRSHHVFVIPFAVLALGSCARETPATSPEIFDRDLAKAYREYDRTMAEPRAPLSFESGRTVSNCREYLEERPRAEISGPDTNHDMKVEYVVCDVVDLLHRARPARPVRRPPSFYSREIADRLDLASFYSSLRPEVEQGEHPVMRSLGVLAPRTEGFAAVSDTEEWYYSFEVVARADFGKDGSEDWLVIYNDKAKQGTYLDWGVLVVDDVARPGLLRAGLQR